MTTPVYGNVGAPEVGTPADATVEIRAVGDPEREWSPVYRVDGTIVGPSNPVPDGDGRWEIDLDPNDDLTPANSYYELRTRTPGMGSTIVERFQVPDQVGAFNYLAGLIDDVADLDDPTPSVAHNALPGRSAADAHPAESITVADDVLAATEVGAAIAELRRRGTRVSLWRLFGHSFGWLYPDDPGSTGGVSRIASLCGATFENFAVSGSYFVENGHDPAANDGGWVALAHDLPLPGRTYNGGTGFPARFGVTTLQTFLNDLVKYQATPTELRAAVKHSLRFAISWARAGGGFRHDEASTGQAASGGWATTADDDNTPDTSYSSTAAAGETWTITTAARMAGQTVGLVFLADYVGGAVPASAITFTLDGSPITATGYASGFDTREQWPAVAAANGVMVARFDLPDDGATHTIVATTGTGGAARWGYIVEAVSPVFVHDVAKVPNLSVAELALVDLLNADIDTVVAEFDDLVVVVEMDAALGNAARWFSDTVHPNQGGHNLVAGAVATALLSVDLTDAQAVLL